MKWFNNIKEKIRKAFEEDYNEICCNCGHIALDHVMLHKECYGTNMIDKILPYPCYCRKFKVMEYKK